MAWCLKISVPPVLAPCTTLPAQLQNPEGAGRTRRNRAPRRPGRGSRRRRRSGSDCRFWLSTLSGSTPRLWTLDPQLSTFLLPSVVVGDRPKGIQADEAIGRAVAHAESIAMSRTTVGIDDDHAGATSASAKVTASSAISNGPSPGRAGLACSIALERPSFLLPKNRQRLHSRRLVIDVSATESGQAGRLPVLCLSALTSHGIPARIVVGEGPELELIVASLAGSAVIQREGY